MWDKAKTVGCPHSSKGDPRRCSQCLGAVPQVCPPLSALPGDPRMQHGKGFIHAIGEIYRKPNTWRRR